MMGLWIKSRLLFYSNILSGKQFLAIIKASPRMVFFTPGLLTYTRKRLFSGNEAKTTY